MMVSKIPGELIIEDAELPPNFGGERIKAEAVVVNIETEKRFLASLLEHLHLECSALQVSQEIFM